MLVNLYRKSIPQNVRDRIYSLFLKDLLHWVRQTKAKTKAKSRYYFSSIYPETEKNSMYYFMGKYGLTPHPWPFSLEYKEPAQCFVEESNGLPYVLHKSKKLFFPKEYSQKQIQDLYRSLVVEQDIRSAHRYLETDYPELKGKIVFDLGGAEGIFSLDSIDYAKHIYLFECEEIWMAPLRATFAPWADKLTLIAKYASDKNNEKETTIDSYISCCGDSDLFIKMDIEGAELSALRGAEEVLKRYPVQMSVCTYHTIWDAEEIQNYLTSLGYMTTFTDGYMYII